MENIIADKTEWVDYLPTSFTLGNHTFNVVQYKELYYNDEYNYGQFDYSELCINILINKPEDFKEPLNKEIVLNSFWHEIFHAFNYLWNTGTDESLAQSFANFMREYQTTAVYAKKEGN